MIEVLVDDCVAGRLGADEVDRLQERMNRMAQAAGLSERAPQELQGTLRLTDDGTIQALNRDYRLKDRPTDVLAFAMREGPSGELHPHLLGDIVVSLDTAERQAKASLVEEILFLAAHGLCHLLGYDHPDDEQEAAMNARMTALLAEAARSGEVQSA